MFGDSLVSLHAAIFHDGAPFPRYRRSPLAKYMNGGARFPDIVEGSWQITRMAGRNSPALVVGSCGEGANYVAAVIFGYISLHAAFFTMMGRNAPAFVEDSWRNTLILGRDPPAYVEVPW